MSQREAKGERELGLIIRKVSCGTTLTRIVEGDYRGYRALLIADDSNVGIVTIGKSNKENITFPVLKTAYVEVNYDLDKVFCIGTDASDVLHVLLEKTREVKLGK